MANPEQLQALGGGPAAWNRWRAENPQMRSDFRFANLGGLDLEGADLSEAKFSGAVLEGADLAGAKLARAELAGSDLSFLSLAGSDLLGSDLSEADLTGADISRVDFAFAKLEGAVLVDVRRTEIFKGEDVGEEFTFGGCLGTVDLAIDWADGARRRESRHRWRQQENYKKSGV